MQMKAYLSDEMLVIKLDGEIDHHTAKQLRQDMDEMIASKRPKTLVLELSDIAFMDSSGLGLILGRYRRLTQIGSVMLIKNASEQTKKLLALAGVDKLIRFIYDTPQDGFQHRSGLEKGA